MALGRPKAPRIVGRYQLVAELAASYLGALWAVRAEGSDGTSSLAALRLVSLARLDADTRVRLLEAAWQAMEVRHPRVRSVTDVVASDGELGIISEYAEGIPLRALQGLASVRRKPFPVPVALRVVTDLLEAAIALDRTTAELGEEAVPLYGGLSPDSIVVGSDGTTTVMDVVVSSVASSVQSLGGNPERVAYAAPEQLDPEAKIDARADVFAVGIVLWELLSSRRLFVGSDKIVGQKVLAARIPRIDEWKKKGDPDLPAGLVAVVTRALARDPAGRYATAEELAAALAACGAAPGTEEDVKRYVETIADGSLARTREAIKEPSKTARPDAAQQWGKLKSPEPVRPVATLSVAAAEKRSIVPGPKLSPALATGPKPLSVALGGPRPRQPTMIGIPPPARSITPLPAPSVVPAPAPSIAPAASAAVTAPPPAQAINLATTAHLGTPAPAVNLGATAPAISSVVDPAAPTARAVVTEDPYDDGSDDPTSQYNARDLLKQVEEMSRRSDPAKRLPSEFPEPGTEPKRLADVEAVPPAPLVPSAVMAPSPAPEEGGWLDDPVMPESVEAVTLREDEPARVSPAPIPTRLTPDPASSLVESAVPTSPRTARSIAPPGATPTNSMRPADRPAFSIPPKAPAPFMPSQMPPPLIHDPRATRKRSASPPAGRHFSRSVVWRVAVSLGLVTLSAVIALFVLRSRQEGDTPPAATRAETVAPTVAENAAEAPAASVAPATETATGAPETPAAAETAEADPSVPSASPDAPNPATSAAPPVTAAVAPSPSMPFGGARSAPKAPRRPSKKARSHFVPDDI